tara:strand:- start:865 stop:3132 length:2268 start_codon:yes stop_codon:yes gene_type:complete
MNKYLLLFFTILFCLITNAQNGCIEIYPLIVSNTNSETSESGDSFRYFDLCAGETISLQASSEVSTNNSFEWLLDGVITSNSNEFEETFNDFGGHILTITTTQNGCDSYSEQVRIRVGTEPQINLSANPSTVCPGVVSSIGSDINSDLNFSAEIETGGWESFPCQDEFAEETYLPDGSGVSYETSITLDCFGESQVLQNVNDILSVDINMEHSYSGDLDIILTSPNGVEVILFEQAGGSTWLGQATDNDASEELVGIGSDYGWSMNPDYNGTMAEAMLAGNTITLDNLNTVAGGTGQSLISSTYEPVGDFNDFLGTPLNGNWTITVTDNLGIDNGWIFSWGITIDDNIIPSSWSFDNYIVDQSFVISNDNIVSYTSNSLNIQPEEEGFNYYTYEVIDNFGCTFYEEIEIYATSFITPGNIDYTNEKCGGVDGVIILDPNGGTPDYNVTWNSGLIGNTISNLSAGTYFYTITDDLGCEISGNQTIENEETGLTFDTEIISDDHCDQGIGEINITPIDGQGPYYFTWSYNDENIPAPNCQTDSTMSCTFTNLIEGTFIFNITDNDGCEGNLSIDIDNIPGPIAIFNQNFDTVTYVDGIVDFINLSSGITALEYEWSFGNGEFSDIENPSYNFNQIGNYFVQLTVTDNFDCSDSYISEVVAVEDYFIWTPSAFTPNGDGKNDLYIPRFHNVIEESFEFFIYDKWGKLVFETTDINTGWNGIRQDNGKIADNSSYSFIAKFITYRNQLQKETGSFLLLK